MKKFLFVAYCLRFAGGQAQIGVYKRSIRIGLKLADRGHQVYVYCPGERNFHDAVTEEAKRRLTFLNLPSESHAVDVSHDIRSWFTQVMDEIRPDLVVIGEAPMGGALLEAALIGVELKLPCVCLDNAYDPGTLEFFRLQHGPMFDGLLLTGLSSVVQVPQPSYLATVPPLVEPRPKEAEVVLNRAGLQGEKLIVVLAYDENVEALGLSLLEQLEDEKAEMIFLTPREETLRKKLRRSNHRLKGLGAASPPCEGALFGLIQAARLAVAKCAFMQLTECLCLRTPVIGFYYKGEFTLDLLPPSYRRLTSSTDSHDADEETVATARRFLEMREEELSSVHDGQLGGAEKAAELLTQFAAKPRRDPSKDCANLGFPWESIVRALESLHEGASPQLEEARSCKLRDRPGHLIFSLACHYRVEEEPRFARLRGHLFASGEDANRERASLEPASRWLFQTPSRDCLIEFDTGQLALPELDPMPQRPRHED